VRRRRAQVVKRHQGSEDADPFGATVREQCPHLPGEVVETITE
jgi:hypothetical protein